MNCVDEGRNITTFNVPYGIVMGMLSEASSFYKNMLLRMAPDEWKNIFVTKTAKQILWGYEVPLSLKALKGGHIKFYF